MSSSVLWTSSPVCPLPIWSISVHSEYMLVPRKCELAVLDPSTGIQIRLLRGHSRPVISTLIFASPALHFASGDIAGVVIIWDPVKGEPIVKYSHSTRVSSLIYNGIHLVSGSGDSVGFWNQNQQMVDKVKVSAPVMALVNTNSTLMVSLADVGILTIEKKCIVKTEPTKYPTSMHAMKSDPDIVLAALWDPSCILVMSTGHHIPLPFGPICLGSFSTGLFCVGGTSGEICLCSLESVLCVIVTDASWITACVVDEDDSLTYATAGGGVKKISIKWGPVFAIHKISVVWRDPEKLDRLISSYTCHAGHLIVKCSVYGKSVAILTANQQCQIFENNVLKSSFSLPTCEEIIMCALHVLVLQGKTLSVVNFSGDIVRTWKHSIEYARVIDGIQGKESVIACISGGEVAIFFLHDTSICLTLINHEHSVQWADTNRNKSILAFIDNYGQLVLLDLTCDPPNIIRQFSNISSAAFVNEKCILLSNASSSIVYVWQYPDNIFRQKFSATILGSTSTTAFILVDGRISSEKLCLPRNITV